MKDSETLLTIVLILLGWVAGYLHGKSRNKTYKAIEVDPADWWKHGGDEPDYNDRDQNGGNVQRN